MSVPVVSLDDEATKTWEIRAMINGGRRETNHGVYFAATPDAVNAIAVETWQEYRAQFLWYAEDAGIGDQDNVDGSETAAGEAYEGSAIFGHGQCAVSLFVNEAMILGYGVNLLKRILGSRGLSKVGSQQELKERLKAYIGGGAAAAAAVPAAAAPALAAPAPVELCTACGKDGRLCLFRATASLPQIQLHRKCCVGKYEALSAGALKKKHGGGKAVQQALDTVRSAYNGQGEIYLSAEFEPGQFTSNPPPLLVMY